MHQFSVLSHDVVSGAVAYQYILNVLGIKEEDWRKESAVTKMMMMSNAKTILCHIQTIVSSVSFWLIV